MTRVERAARTLKCEPVLDHLKANRHLLVAAARQQGYAPVRAVSAELLSKFGAAIDFSSPPIRQWCGIACRAVLEPDFEVDERVRIVGDRIFKTGATYRPIGGAAVVDDILVRFVSTLTRSELGRARSLIDAALA